jgi:hypothetical protein
MQGGELQQNFFDGGINMRKEKRPREEHKEGQLTRLV